MLAAAPVFTIGLPAACDVAGAKSMSPSARIAALNDMVPPSESRLAHPRTRQLAKWFAGEHRYVRFVQRDNCAMSHDHGSELTDTQRRVRALETILVDKGYVDPA